MKATLPRNTFGEEIPIESCSFARSELGGDTAIPAKDD